MSVRFGVLLLCVLVVAVFGQTLGGAFVWDDEVLIVHNRNLREADALRAALTADFWDSSLKTDARPGYWRPVVKVSHVVLLQLGGGSPWLFHLVNVGLHLASVLLAFSWLRRRLGDSGVDPETSAIGAGLGAALFAVHVSRFESVGWVAGGTELFFGCFGLLGLWTLDQPRARWAAVVPFTLAMLSKESAVVLPLALALDGWLRGRRDLVRSGAPAAGVAVALGLGLRALAGVSLPSAGVSHGVVEAAARVCATVGAYHLRTVTPWSVSAWPFDVPPSGTALERFGLPLVLLGSVLVLAWAVLLGFTSRRPALRPWLADALWWLVLLSPVLQVIPLPPPTFVNDRFLYLPLLGVASLVARGVATARDARRRPLLLAGGGVVLVSAAALGFALPAYRSSLDFFQREYRLHPGSAYLTSIYAGQLLKHDAPHARRVLLVRLARQRQDRRVASWALGHLANTTLELSPFDDERTLLELGRFYEALLAGRPVGLQLGEQVFEVPGRPEQLLGQAARGQLDDVALFAATVDFRLGRLDAASRRLEQLVREAPTARRVTLLAQVLGASRRFDDGLALLDEQSLRFATLRTGPVRRALDEARRLAPEQAAPLQWVTVWRALGALGEARGALAAVPGLRTPERVLAAAELEFDLGHAERALELLDTATTEGLAPARDALRRRLAADAAAREQQLALVAEE